MSTIDFSTKPIVSEVFRFVSIRNPKRSTILQQQHGHVPFRMSYGSGFHQLLSDIRNDEALDIHAKRASLAEAARNYLDGPSGIQSIGMLKEATGDLHLFHPWLRAHADGLQYGDVEAAWPGLSPLDDFGKGRLWENLFAMLVVGGSGGLRESLIEALLAQHFLEGYLNGGELQSPDVIQALTHADLILPGTIFPLPRQVQELEGQEPEPDKPTHQDPWLTLQRLLPALDHEFECQWAELRAKTDEVGPEGEPTGSSNRIVLSQAFIEAQEAEAQELMDGLRLIPGTDLLFAREALVAYGQRLPGPALTEGVVGRRVIVYGGGIWSQEHVASGKGGALRMAGDTENPVWNDWNLKGTGEPSCGVRPLGVADLKKVEQKLCCYAPGEVAHIENILQGEYKERSTRRLKRREETFVTVTEREQMDERDSISTERYELSKETAMQIQKDTALEVGVSASYYGPVNALSLRNLILTLHRQEGRTLSTW